MVDDGRELQGLNRLHELHGVADAGWGQPAYHIFVWFVISLGPRFAQRRPLLLRESFKFGKMTRRKSLREGGLRAKMSFKFVSSCFKFVMEVAGNEGDTRRRTKKLLEGAENPVF